MIMFTSFRNILLFFSTVIIILLMVFLYFLINYILYWKTIVLITILVLYVIIYFFVRKINKLKKLENNKFQSVTEENNLFTQKTKEIEKLKKLEKYRREFLGNVSHELKTPIFNIQGYISTLLDGAINDKNVNIKYLEKAEQNVNRLITIVKDLELISKLESGELNLKIENFNIVQVVKEIFELQEMRAKKLNIKLNLTDSDKIIIVSADRQRIFDVINNLVINSLIYGRQNGTTTVTFHENNNKILVEVADSGIGIEEKHLPRLFERFYRVDKSRSRDQGGTGLGLAIVKHILEVHSETINVKSTIGEGSVFTFTLSKAK